jgi:hypothetical protein
MKKSPNCNRHQQQHSPPPQPTNSSTPLPTHTNPTFSPSYTP